MTSRRDDTKPIAGRARELRAALAAQLELEPDTVGNALVAFLGGVHTRLPHGTAVALVSWLPEAWALLASRPVRGARGSEALRACVAEAGVPADKADAFICEVLRMIGERVGTPIADALRKRLPELAEIERDAVVAMGRAPVQPSERRNPVTASSPTS